MAKDKIDRLTEIVKLGFANLDARIIREQHLVSNE
jgi:hypothetical protein